MPAKRKAKSRAKNQVKTESPEKQETEELKQETEEVKCAKSIDQQRTLSLFVGFQETFLQGEALRRMLHYFSCNCSECDQDNLTDIMLKMLCTPIDITLTKIGLNAFKDNYMLTLPYSEMTKQQKSFLCESVTKDIAFSRSVSVMANMNGGVCMRLYQIDKETVFIQQEILMRALVDCVLLDVVSHNVHTRWLIFTIVLQRIMSKTQLERSAVQRISDYALQLRNDTTNHAV